MKEIAFTHIIAHEFGYRVKRYIAISDKSRSKTQSQSGPFASVVPLGLDRPTALLLEPSRLVAARFGGQLPIAIRN